MTRLCPTGGTYCKNGENCYLRKQIGTQAKMGGDDPKDPHLAGKMWSRDAWDEFAQRTKDLADTHCLVPNDVHVAVDKETRGKTNRKEFY